MYKAVVEQLAPLTSIGVDEWPHVIERYFHTAAHYESEIGYARHCTRTLMDAAIEGHQWNLIRDEHLKQALKIVSSIMIRTGKSSDIHEFNVMVRRTPGGPQLVILDPLE